jgi:hypothetical protein
VNTLTEIESTLERIISRVQPGRYTGGEINQVLKDWNSVNSQVALVFPDLMIWACPTWAWRS